MTDLEMKVHSLDKNRTEMMAKLKDQDHLISDLKHNIAFLKTEAKAKEKQDDNLQKTATEVTELKIKLKAKEAEEQKLKDIVRGMAERLSKLRANRLFTADVKLE